MMQTRLKNYQIGYFKHGMNVYFTFTTSLSKLYPASVTGSNVKFNRRFGQTACLEKDDKTRARELRVKTVSGLSSLSAVYGQESAGNFTFLYFGVYIRRKKTFERKRAARSKHVLVNAWSDIKTRQRVKDRRIDKREVPMYRST